MYYHSYNISHVYFQLLAMDIHEDSILHTPQNASTPISQGSGGKSPVRIEPAVKPATHGEFKHVSASSGRSDEIYRVDTYKSASLAPLRNCTTTMRNRARNTTQLMYGVVVDGPATARDTIYKSQTSSEIANHEDAAEKVQAAHLDFTSSEARVFEFPVNVSDVTHYKSTAQSKQEELSHNAKISVKNSSTSVGELGSSASVCTDIKAMTRTDQALDGPGEQEMMSLKPYDVLSSQNMSSFSSDDLSPSLLSLSPNDVSVLSNMLSLSPNDVSVSPNIISLSPNDVSISQNLIPLLPNDVPVSPMPMPPSSIVAALSTNDTALSTRPEHSVLVDGSYDSTKPWFIFDQPHSLTRNT